MILEVLRSEFNWKKSEEEEEFNVVSVFVKVNE